MGTLLSLLLVFLIYFIFLYFIDIKVGTRSSFIARLILCEVILSIIHFTAILTVDKLFFPWWEKVLLLGIFSLWGFILFVLMILAIIYSVFCFVAFLTLLAEMVLPKITYCAKIAPIMSLITMLIIFILSFSTSYFAIHSIILTAIIMLILTPLVFADRDYEVKLNKLKEMPDIFETTFEERKEIYIQQQKEIEDLNKSYRRNIFVRFNREL